MQKNNKLNPSKYLYHSSLICNVRVILLVSLKEYLQFTFRKKIMITLFNYRLNFVGILYFLMLRNTFSDNIHFYACKLGNCVSN